MSRVAGVNYTLEMYRPCYGAGAAFTAIQIAMKYLHKSPTVAGLMADHGMSRATAYRWLAAFKAAKGEA